MSIATRVHNNPIKRRLKLQITCSRKKIFFPPQIDLIFFLLKNDRVKCRFYF